MFKYHPYTVAPKIPEELSFLQTLAGNVWWSWNFPASNLFRSMNPRLFKECGLNPLRLLSELPQERFEELRRDDAFLAQLAEVRALYEKNVLQSRHWSEFGAPHRCVAYFSLEFGLHESIHLYSGGLGILAGDHLKSASDLDLPVVGIGLFYREGYFEQRINEHGQQYEVYSVNDPQYLPMTRMTKPDGLPVLVSVPICAADGRLWASVWRLDVGRIPLVLLDTNIPENPPELRAVTGRLYGGDPLMRLRQEMLLGVGGLRALRALGYEVSVSHMNEGHAAFLGPERMSQVQRDTGCDLDTARELVRRTSVFTTHTPVPAGNETFKLDLLRPRLEAYCAEVGNIPLDKILEWGHDPHDTGFTELSMTVLGLNCAYYTNGVAKKHGDVERDMWQHLWPEFPREEVPIGHVTNGVHVASWMSRGLRDLLSQRLGPGWENRALDSKTLDLVLQIPDEELWHIREHNRRHLVRSVREHLERRLRMRNAPSTEIARVRTLLDPDALTIGFARRFATYKRATLLLRDVERLARIVSDSGRPVQFLFAGKAHPADNGGKELIRRVIELSRDPRINGRVVFLEDYDIRIARHLVRGVDVWLNNPRRPMEASGTSGMKVCINGGIHLSTMDGWWCEGYSPACGWAIGDENTSGDDEYIDNFESQALYNLLETEVVPQFYDRPDGGLPTRWIRMMKESIRMSLRAFSSHRMVTDYMNLAYMPALHAWETLSADKAAPAAKIVAHRTRIAALWDGVRVGNPVAETDVSTARVGDEFNVSVEVSLGEIPPEAVVVQVVSGALDTHGGVRGAATVEMERAEDLGDGRWRYRAAIRCTATGRFGFTARAVPRGAEWRGLMPGYITWATWDE